MIVLLATVRLLDNVALATYPETAPPSDDYIILRKYQSDMSELHAYFALRYLTQFNRQLGLGLANHSRSCKRCNANSAPKVGES